MLLALITAVFAQTAELPCPNQSGSTARYLFDYQATKPEGATAFERTYTLTVGETQGGGFPVVFHSTGSTVKEVPSGPGAAATQALVESPIPDVTAQVRFPDGVSQVTFDNLDEVTTALREPVQAALLSSVPQGASQSQIDQVIGPLLDVVLAPAVVERSLSGYYLPIYGYACQTWPVGETSEDVVLPNPLGGEPFPARATVTIHPEADDGSRRIDELQVLKDIDVQELIGPMLGPMGIPEDAIAPLLDMPVQITVSTNITLDSDGWLRTSTSHKVVELLGQRQTENTTIRRMTPP